MFALRISKGADCHDVGMMNIDVREVVGTRTVSWGRPAAFTEDEAVYAGPLALFLPLAVGLRQPAITAAAIRE